MKKHTLHIATVISLLVFLASCTKTPQNSPQAHAASIDSTPSQSTTVKVKHASARPKGSINQSRETAITQAVRKVSPAVVSITVTEMQSGRQLQYNRYYRRFFSVPNEHQVKSMGSGFIISSDGLVVTNQHVANKNAKKIVVSLQNGSQYDAKVLGSDELSDLSLLKIETDKDFPEATFGNSDSVMVGEWSLAIGNPFGLFKAAEPSVTVGVVSAKNRDFRPNPNEPRVYTDMIQTDAAINAGNSGGPLVDSQGHVIGVNTFIYTGGTSNGFVGLGFAIPSNRVQEIIHQLAVSGKVTIPYNLGMKTEQMTQQLIQRYNLSPIPGLLVTKVNKNGPAFDAGIVPGDILLKVGDERIQSEMHMKALYREYAEGDTMRVELYRDGKRYEAKIKLRRKVTE